MGKRRFIDLSVPLMETPQGFFPAVEITRVTHEENAKRRAKEYDVPVEFFPDGKAAAYEILKVTAHGGTHFDAPWHFSPMSMGKPSKTIDEIPLEWCFGNGVVLDLTYVKGGDRISAANIREALDKIRYKLKPFDIVLIWTNVSKHYLEPNYDYMGPTVTREATLWLIDQGIKVMGIDAKGWDRARKFDLDEYRQQGINRFWEGHFTGREKEYCHIENLANLDAIPQPYGFSVVVFPIKIKGGSAGWVRAVAILDE